MPAVGSGGTGPVSGPSTAAGISETGGREWMDLRRQGDEVLSGRPQQGPIQLITIYAPGGAGDHLIVRQTSQSDDSYGLTVTAPDRMTQHVKRATIFVTSHLSDPVLLEWNTNVWIMHQPHRLHLTSPVGPQAGKEEWIAFTVSGLGSYRLLSRAQADGGLRTGPDRLIDTSERFHGRAIRAAMPGLSAMLILGVGWIGSRWMHSRECRRRV